MIALSRVAAPAALAVAALLLTPIRVAAQTELVDEVKIGALAHDVAFFTHHVESGTDVNFELLFTAPIY